MKKYSSFPKIVFLVFFAAASGAGVIGFGRAQDSQANQLSPIISSPSSVGEVAFPHLFHFEDLGLECQTCHHETDAARLKMPHEEYFNDFWIDCTICHKRDNVAVSQPQSCSNCHHDSPTDMADETLSAKVVIHKNCWECHEVEQGEAASKSCTFCHKKRPDESPGL